MMVFLGKEVNEQQEGGGSTEVHTGTLRTLSEARVPKVFPLKSHFKGSTGGTTTGWWPIGQTLGTLI